MKKGKAETTASDEAIIFPESETTIKGEKITVNEISYSQGMQIHFQIKPMIESMSEAFAEANPDFSMMEGVFAEHLDIVNKMMALTTGKTEAWVNNLSDEEGQLLLMTFWMVNSGFFIRRIAGKAIQKMQQKIKPSRSDTETSSAG